MCFQWKTLKNSIHYIGKESNELEQSEIFGVSKKDTMEYVNHQKKLRETVVSLTLNGALKLGLDKREFFRLKKKAKSNKPITLRKKILEKIIEKVNPNMVWKLFFSKANNQS